MEAEADKHIVGEESSGGAATEAVGEGGSSSGSGAPFVLPGAMPVIAEEHQAEVEADCEASTCMTTRIDQICTEVEDDTANIAMEADADGLTQMLEELSESEDVCEV